MARRRAVRVSSRRCSWLLAVAAVGPRCLPGSQYTDLDAAERPDGRPLGGSLDADRPRAVWYHVGSKNEKPGRTGFAHLFEHMMFKGSKNVEPEEHTSLIASVGGQSNAYTTDDETVFWETRAGAVPAAGAVARGRPDGHAPRRQGQVRQRTRGREGRAADAGGQPAVRPPERDHLRPGLHHASLQASDDRQHGGPRGGVDRGRARVLPDLLRAGERDASCIVGDFDHGAGEGSWSTQYFGRVPKAEHPVPRDIPKEPPQTKEKRVTIEEPWPLPAVVVAYHITYDGHPDSYPLHIASKVLSDGQSSRIYQKLVYETAAGGRGVWRSEPDRGPEPVLCRGDRAAGPVAGRGDQGAHRANSTGSRRSRSPSANCSAPRTSSRATTSSAASRTSRRRCSWRTRSVHSQRHHDGGRRVRDLPEHHRGGRAARGAHLLHRREPAGADDHAGARRRRRESRGARCTSRCVARGSCVVACLARSRRLRRAGAARWPSRRRRGRCRRASRRSRRTRLRTLANGLQVVVGAAPRAAGRQHAHAGPRRRAQDPRGQVGPRRSRGVAARPGHDDEVGASRSTTRSTSWAAPWAPARAPT